MKIINADKEFVLYADGSSERMTDKRRAEIVTHLKAERVFYCRYVMELEEQLESNPERADFIGDLIGKADAEYTKITSILSKLI